jgi:CRISPR system Cascade subunit CasA
MTSLQILACGYDMKQMKARGFVESLMPVRLPPEPLDPQEFEVLIRQLVGGAREAVFSLTTAVRLAAYGESRSAPKDGGLMSLARDRFWDRTEPLFFAALASFDAVPQDEQAIGAQLLAVPREWRSQLMDAALAVFDALVPLDRIEDGEMERVVTARRQLVRTLTGYDNGGKRLFHALQLEAPETKAKKQKRKSA